MASTFLQRRSGSCRVYIVFVFLHVSQLQQYSKSKCLYGNCSQVGPAQVTLQGLCKPPAAYVIRSS